MTTLGTREREGVENVSIEDDDGDGPFADVRPNDGGGGTVDDGEVLSVIGVSRPDLKNLYAPRRRDRIIVHTRSRWRIPQVDHLEPFRRHFPARLFQSR